MGLLIDWTMQNVLLVVQNYSIKDACKSALKCGDVIKEWRWKVDSGAEWKQLFCQTRKKVNKKRIQEYERKREKKRRKKVTV